MDIIITESQLKYIIKETFNVDYTFDRFNTTFDSKYGPPKVFFNNTVKVSGNRDYETEIYRFTRKDGEVYQFDSRDIGFSKNNGNAFIKLSDFEIEYPEEGDKFREMIELEKKNNELEKSKIELEKKSNEKTVSSVDINQVIDNPLSSTNQAFFKKNISGIPQTISASTKSVYSQNWGKINDDECETGEGVLDVETVGGGQRWSIINYFDTNPKVINILTNEFLNEHDNFTINDFKNWISRESEKLFGENSPILKRLIQVNRQSLTSGLKTEEYAIDHLINKFGVSPKTIKQYCSGSEDDRKKSRDIKFVGKFNKDYYIQVKPLKSITKNGKKYDVSTNGMKDSYKMFNRDTVDYIGYANKNELILFPNKQYSTQENGGKAIHYVNPVEDI
jgi:hypothetical protein